MLPNQSVFEYGRKKKKEYLHRVAAEKEAILEAAEGRKFGPMGADATNVLKVIQLFRLRLLGLALISRPLRSFSTNCLVV